MAFQSLIKLLRDGIDKVDAGTVNKILRALDSNVRYLKDLFDASAVGKNLIVRSVAVEPDALVNQAVYWNSDNLRFERALAAADTDDDDNLVLSPSAQVWGIILSKPAATSADILVSGYIDTDLANAITGDVVPGVYYLSSTTPGKLVTEPPAVTVTILQADGNGSVLVRPFFRDALDLFANVDTTVTSIVSLSDRLIIKCAVDDSEASAGPLTIDLDLQFLVDDNSLHEGFRVLKSLDDDTFFRGPVVQGLRAGNNITLSATYENPDESIGFQDVVTINADLEIDGKLLLPSEIRLDNALQEFHEGVIGYELSEGRTSSITGCINVPTSLPDGTTMKLRFWLLARDAGDLPVLTLTRRRLVRPDGVTPEDLETSDTSTTITTDIEDLTEDQYIEVDSEDFEIAGGDRVLYTLARSNVEAGVDTQIIFQAGVLVN